MERKQAIVIGGGPVGVHVLGKLTKEGVDAVLLEASSGLGGQLLGLYPEKTVDDVKGYAPMKAKELWEELVRDIDMSRVFLNERVVSLDKEEGGYLVRTKDDEFHAEAVFLATGLGFYHPRTMGLEGEEEYPNILYALIDPKELADKKVVVFGGGDSALDWAKELSSYADISLVHRRDEFRGDGEKIDGLPIHVYLPYIPRKLIISGGICGGIRIESVKDGSSIDLEADYILVNFGLIPESIELPYEKAKNGFGYLSGEASRLDDGLYCVGDISYREGKRKRMEPGFEEADASIRDYLSRKG